MIDETKSCFNDTESENDNVLKIYAESIAKRERFVKYDITITKITQKGQGYLAAPYEIDIKGETSDGEKEINLFVKNIIIANDKFEGFFSINEAYERECYVYKELSKIFNQLQEGIVPKEERLNMVKCYEESSLESIIMENLSIKGYKTVNRMEVPSVKFLELSMEQLAKLHGLGFVIQKRMPEYFNNNMIKDRFPADFNEKWVAIAKSLIGVTIKSLNSEARKKIEGFVPQILSKLEGYYNDESTIRTLCHGDFRVMNLLMKEINGEVTEVIPIDYQVMYYGCPVTDILYLLYGSTDRKMRKQHFEQLINLYYDTLTRFLKYFKIDVKEVYPRKELNAAIEKRSDLGLMIALYFYPIFFASDDDVPDIADDFTTIDFKLDDKVMKRVEEIIEDFEEASLL